MASDLLDTVMAMRVHAQALGRSWRAEADAAERRAKSMDPHDPGHAYAVAEELVLRRCAGEVLLIVGPPESTATCEDRQG